MIEDLPKKKFQNFIPELDVVPRIRTFSDIIKIKDFVFSIVPLFKDPSDNKLILHVNNVMDLYQSFKELNAGGWCGLNASFFDILMHWYGIQRRPYNFGFTKMGFTHIGILATYDSAEFFIDPYLGIHYAHSDGFPLTFPHLINLITERKFDKIIPIYSDNIFKPIQQEDGSFTLASPSQMNSIVFCNWEKCDQVMLDTFGETNKLLLMLIKI
jgi:hypothetical protein